MHRSHLHGLSPFVVVIIRTDMITLSDDDKMSISEPDDKMPMTTVSRTTSLRRNRSKMERVLGYGADQAVKVGDGDDDSFVTADEP